MASVIRGSDNFDTDTSVALERLSSGTANGSSIIDISLTGTYKAYQLHLFGFYNTSNSNNTHFMTMFSGATHYTSAGQYRHRGGTHARIDLAITDTNSNGDGMSGLCTIINPHNTAHWTGCLWSGYKLDNGSLQDVMNENRSGVLTQKNNVDKVRLGLTAGTWNDGDWVLYGVNT